MFMALLLACDINLLISDDHHAFAGFSACMMSSGCYCCIVGYSNISAKSEGLISSGYMSLSLNQVEFKNLR